MNTFTAFLTATLALGVAAAAPAAGRYFCDLRSDKLSASFNCGGEGLTVSFDGVSIIRNSSLWVHNPPWNFHYYGLPSMKDNVEVKEIEGGKEAIVPHRSEYFEGIQRYRVTKNKLSIEFKYKLLKDVKDADVENCFGTFCAAPILGRPYKAVTTREQTVEGVLPIAPKQRDPWKATVSPDPFKRLEIDSRVGKMTIDVSGEPAGLTMMDYRLSAYERADKSPVFWCGAGSHLEYGKEYTQTITLTIDPVAKPGPAQPVQAAKSEASEKSDIRLPFAGQVHVIPEPQQMKMTVADFHLSADTQIVVGETAYSEDYRGAKSFAAEVKLLYGFEPKIARESDANPSAPRILVGEAALNKTLAAAAVKAGIAAPDRDEGYALAATGEQVLVLGKDRVGSYWGMQTLKQLLKYSSGGVAIQGCSIVDWPSLKFRGVHLFTGNRALPFHKKLIDRILSRYKINNIILEVDFMKWKSDPEIAVDFSAEQADVKRDIDYARQRFIEVSPLLQSLGHCDHLFWAGKNRDIAEYPEHPYSYCASNPRTYPYVFKLYDEVIELFGRPKFVHIGHDEVYEPGGFPKCAECKKRSAEQIFVDDTQKVSEHLAKHGARVMMWGDMMLARGDAPDATNASSPEMARWIRDRMPKDAIITDWHYAAGKPEEFKSLEIFMKEGRQAIASTWYTPQNIEAFANQAKKVGALGLLQTTWAGFNSNEDNLKNSFNQFSTMILAAEYAWNSGKTDLDHLPYDWDEEFRRVWSQLPLDCTPRKGFTLDLSAAANMPLADDDKNAGWMGLGSKHDMSSLPTGDVRLKGDMFRIGSSAIRLAGAFDAAGGYPAAVTITIGRKAAALLFLHTTQWIDQAKRDVGSYTIKYSDGTSAKIELLYGANITAWIDQRSISGAEKVWGGRTADDERISLQRLQWENPSPDKVIESVEFTSARTEAGPVLLAISGIE